MNWLRRFMYGRYGNDKLNTFLLIIYFIIAVLFLIFDTIYLWIASMVPVIIALFRMLSKNYAKRSAENRAFMKIFQPFTGFFKTKRAQMKDNSHRYFKCPACKATLRVPRNVGKIEITCPACKKKITRKT